MITNWIKKEFSSIAQLSKDKFYPQKSNDNKKCIELENIQKETGCLSGYFFSKTQLSTKNIFSKGNVLFGKLRPNLRKYLYCDFDGVCSSEIWVLIPQKNVYSKYLFYLVQQERFIQSACVTSGSKMPRSDWQYVSQTPFYLPPLPEQKAIASLLEKWDTAIEKTEALIAAKQKQFEWLVTSLINKSGHKKAHLLDFVAEVSKRNQDNSLNRVLSVTNHSGFVLPENQFEKRVASTNISNYKVVESGQYAYNPARINVGSIARLDDWDNGVVSPMYTVFKLNTEKVESNYFLYWLSSNEAKQRIRNSAQGSVRKTVSFDDLSLIPIALPNIRTQETMTKKLNISQQEITLLKQLVKQYHAQKRGLMQKLLTSKWRLKI